MVLSKLRMIDVEIDCAVPLDDAKDFLFARVGMPMNAMTGAM